MTESPVPNARQEGARLAVATRLEHLAAIATELDDQDLASEAHAERQRLLEAQFFAACIGQFKRGKSTLINALVGESVLPVGVIPVTSVVTVLLYGDVPSANVRFDDGHRESTTLDAIADFVDERRNPGNRRGAVIVEVALPKAILRDGLCLVDTPGLGSVHATNTEATRAFVPRIDVALIVVGPDPPISGEELELVQEASREAGDLAVIVNKSDQVSPEQLREVLEFTRATVESAIRRPVERLFSISALERLTIRAPTGDWAALESYLTALSANARERLVGTAGDRAVSRLARRLASEVSQRDEALRRPLVQIRERVGRLRQALNDLDQDLVDLRYLFDAVEAGLGTEFEKHRTRFVQDTLGDLQCALAQWIDRHASADPTLRRPAFEEAHRLAAEAVQRWFDTMDPRANALYQAFTERLVRAANDYVARISVDAADLHVDDLAPDLGFRVRRQFYFASLMHLAGGSPITWLVDRFASRAMRQAKVAEAASAYLTHLLESNSHRVENDFKDRTRESRRWLEGQIRARLAGALRSAERAVAIATEAQHLSEADLEDRLQRVGALRGQLATLGD
ncbi:MAG: dynamin family protein [Acidobacteria bacterium]|nr:dynamin family protein [Acidobacteriota bacterium]